MMEYNINNVHYVNLKDIIYKKIMNVQIHVLNSNINKILKQFNVYMNAQMISHFQSIKYAMKNVNMIRILIKHII